MKSHVKNAVKVLGYGFLFPRSLYTAFYSCDVFPVFLCFASWHCQTFVQIYSVIVAALHCVLTLPCSIKTDKLTQAIVRIE